jgi:hypothetical protein
MVFLNTTITKREHHYFELPWTFLLNRLLSIEKEILKLHSKFFFLLLFLLLILLCDVDVNDVVAY